MLEKHKNVKTVFLSPLKLNKNAKYRKEKVSLRDFKQGSISNCGLVAALASMSKRPEFLSEVAPVVDQTNDGVRLHFSMYHKGEPVTVTIDDKLPFYEPNSLTRLFGIKPWLACASSFKSRNFYSAPLFEKAVVKLACSGSYERCLGMKPKLVFSLLSDCLSLLCAWEKFERSEHDLEDLLQFELSNGSSVVLSVKPDIFYNRNDVKKDGHAYTVVGYNKKRKSIKLYNPNFQTVAIRNLRHLFLGNANLTKGELWVPLDHLDRRFVSVCSLQSKNMYISNFVIKRKLKQTDFDENYLCTTHGCQVDIQKNQSL